MRALTLALSATLSAAPAPAASAAPADESTGAPATADTGSSAEPDLPIVQFRRSRGVLRVVVRPPRGHHIAPDLPLRASLDGSRVRIEEHAAPGAARGPSRFDLPLAPVDGPAAWTLRVWGGVCDDVAETCVPFAAEGAVERPGPVRGSLVVAAGFPPPRRAPIDAVVESGGETLPEILDRGPVHTQRTLSGPEEFDAVLASARARSVPVVLDFSAHWCPPCQRLKHELLQAHAYADRLARFEVLIADADDPRSFALKDRYDVTGYPTVLVLSGDGSVLDRIIGYSSAETTMRRFEEASGTTLVEPRRALAAGSIDAAWNTLQSGMPSASGTDLVRILTLLVEAGGRLPSEDPRRATIPSLQVRLASLCPEPGAAAMLLVDAARTASKQSDSAVAADAVAALDALWSKTPRVITGGDAPPEREPLAATVVALPAATLDDLALLHWAVAEQRGESKLKGQAALIWSVASLVAHGLVPPARAADAPRRVPAHLAEWLDEPRISAALLDDEGRMHDIVDALIDSGHTQIAESLLRDLAERHADRFAWPHRLAGFLLSAGRAVDAEAPARRALDTATGDHRLRAVLRLGEVLVALGRSAEARPLFASALDEPPPPEDVRTHRYRAQIQSALGALPAVGAQP